MALLAGALEGDFESDWETVAVEVVAAESLDAASLDALEPKY